MKICLSVLLVLLVASFSSSVQADHHEVFIQDVVLLDSDSCAVELEIDLDNQDNFQGVDRIEINGTLLAAIGDTEAATINAGGNVNAGDNILFSSNDFVTETGLQADIEFADANCSSFVAGAVFSFVIDDPAFGGLDTVIDSVTLPVGFALNSAAVRSSDTSSPDLLSLFDESVTVRNNAGQQITLGEDEDIDGGGCQLSTASIGSSSTWQILLFSLLALGLARRQHIANPIE